MTGLLLIKACWGTDVQKEREKGRQLRESRWCCGDLRKLKESLRGRTERFSKGPEPGIWLNSLWPWVVQGAELSPPQDAAQRPLSGVRPTCCSFSALALCPVQPRWTQTGP